MLWFFDDLLRGQIGVKLRKPCSVKTLLQFGGFLSFFFGRARKSL